MDRACRLFPGGGSEECLCGGGFQGNGTIAVKASPPVVSLGRRGHKQESFVPFLQRFTLAIASE